MSGMDDLIFDECANMGFWQWRKWGLNMSARDRAREQRRFDKASNVRRRRRRAELARRRRNA